MEQEKDKDKEEDKIEGEIKKYAADAAKRISKVIHEEDTKRKEIKKILADFHTAVNEREKILREDISRTHSEKMANIDTQAEELKKAVACGDIDAVNDLLKKMS